MSKYHVNPETGNAGPCSAKVQCPFGGDEAHYDTPDDARKAYEAVQAAVFAVSLRKDKPAGLIAEPSSAEGFGEEWNEIEDIKTLAARLDEFLGGYGMDFPTPLLGREERQRIDGEYMNHATVWLRLELQSKTRGLSEEEAQAHQKARELVDERSLQLGHPNVAEFRRAISHIESERLEAETLSEIQALDAVYPASSMGNPGSAKVRRDALNKIRNQAEEDRALYKHAAPEDREGYLMRTDIVLTVEAEELAAERAAAGPQLTKAQVEDFDFRQGTLRKELRAATDELLKLRS